MDLTDIVINGLPSSQMGGWFFFVLMLQFVWLASIISVARKKTEDPYDRIVWLLIVLLLNILGTLLYFFVGPEEGRNGPITEAEIKRRANEGKL